MRVSGVRKPGELTMSIALVLTYHAVDSGSPPLSVEPALFREHLSVIAEAGVRTVTIAELAAELRAGDPRAGRRRIGRPPLLRRRTPGGSIARAERPPRRLRRGARFGGRASRAR